MKIVIDIPEKMYIDIYNGFRCVKYIDVLFDAAQKSAPLPKGHGDLIDRDKIPYRYINQHIKGEMMAYEYEIKNIPTVIAAEREE